MVGTQGLESAMGHRGASPNISYIEDPHNPVKPRTGGVQLLGMPFQGLGHVCVGGAVGFRNCNIASIRITEGRSFQ